MPRCLPVVHAFVDVKGPKSGVAGGSAADHTQLMKDGAGFVPRTAPEQYPLATKLPESGKSDVFQLRRLERVDSGVARVVGEYQCGVQIAAQVADRSQQLSHCEQAG